MSWPSAWEDWVFKSLLKDSRIGNIQILEGMLYQRADVEAEATHPRSLKMNCLSDGTNSMPTPADISRQYYKRTVVEIDLYHRDLWTSLAVMSMTSASLRVEKSSL